MIGDRYNNKYAYEYKSSIFNSGSNSHSCYFESGGKDIKNSTYSGNYSIYII